MVRNAPAIAAGKMPNEVRAIPATPTRATPREAPELTPKTNGPAKGFLKTLCITSPETARPAPPNVAAIANGKRKFQNTTECSLLSKTD